MRSIHRTRTLSFGFLLSLSLLTGCQSSDPLAIASGPIYPLNAGRWQPTPHDLAATPVVAPN